MSAINNRPAPLQASELLEMLQKIEAHWPILPSGMWNSSSIQQLSRHLHELARRCEQAGADELYGLSHAIDEAITRVIDANAPPDDREIENLSRQLDELRTLAGEVRSSTPPRTETPQAEADTEPLDLVYLADPDEKVDALIDALEAKGLRYRILSDPQTLPEVVADPGVKVLVMDAALLDSQPLEPVLRLLKIDRSAAPVLLAICDRSTIEMRLFALRAGATHLFSKPIDCDLMIDSLQEYLHPPPKPRHRILIVEDDESQANFAAGLLRKGGMDCLTINDPLSVMDAVVEFQPDLILMDLYMPGADGIELTRLIRERRDSSAIPVVFLSGEEDPEKKLLTLLAGADDFLTKPVRPQLLLATVNTRIARTRQIAELAIGQATEKARLYSRRELLSRLDLELAGGNESPSFHALLVICLDEPPPAQELEEGEKDVGLLGSAVDELLPQLQPEDTLAALNNQRLALLYRREDEVAVESLAERIYTLLSARMSELNQGRIGIGMTLLNDTQHNAYEQLRNAEMSAASAYLQGRQGYELHGDTTPLAAEGSSALGIRREKIIKSIESRSVPFQKLRFAGRVADAPETFELVPLPFPAFADEEPFEVAEACGLSVEFDCFVCKKALQELGEQLMQGRLERLIFRQSATVLKEPDYLEFIRSEMRRLQIVGTGLMVEFDLPSLATDLLSARALINELKGVGIGVALGNFACNETAYRVLAYLKADAARPQPSLLEIDAKKIPRIARKLHSLRAEIILPRISRQERVSAHWREYADYVQADSSDSA